MKRFAEGELTSVSAHELGCAYSFEILKINTSVYGNRTSPRLEAKESCLPSKDSDPSVHYDNFCLDEKEEDEM